MLPLYVV